MDYKSSILLLAFNSRVCSNVYSQTSVHELNSFLKVEPSGSRNPLGGFLALDVILKARTIFSPLVAWVTKARKCKAPVGNISSLQAHTAK